MTPVTAAVLAHQGGWDEILFVLTPLAVFAGLLALARKRADQLDTDGREGDLRDSEAAATDAVANLPPDTGQG